ncbi:MAG: amidohydrolase family protein [Fimbriimonas sp.]
MLSNILFGALLAVQVPSVAITDARIEIGNGQVIEKGSILITGDKITGIGAGLEIPATASVIDGKGLTIYPGFIDGYFSGGVKIPDAPPAATPPNNTLTAPATMWVKNRKGIRSDIKSAANLDLGEKLTDWQKQGFTAALVAPGGSASLRGSTTFSLLRAGKPEEIALTPEAGQEMSFRNGTTAGYPDSLLGVIALLRQTLSDGKQFAEKKALEANPEKDPALEGLGPVLAGTVPAMFSVDTRLEIVRATQISKEFGMKLIVLGARDSFKEIDRLKANQTPVILSLNLGSEPSKKLAEGSAFVPQKVLDARYAVWEERAKGAIALDQAKIPFGFASSAAGVEETLKNLRRVISLGLPRASALNALTSQPAAIFGVSDRLGSLEVGKLANLTIMDGDFAADKTEVKMVFVGGVKVDFTKKEEKK